PLYTCIVTIHSPSKGIYYGGLVAGPVFKEIAEKVYSTNIQSMQPLNTQPNNIVDLPFIAGASTQRIKYLTQKINIPLNITNAHFITPLQEDSVKYNQKIYDISSLLNKNIMPDLKGIAISEILPLLESKKIKTQINGYGWITHQSILPNTKIKEGQKLILTLNPA
ncbi:MAG: PASTA domain-containing protein, partial [Bacteroidetes bacterium]